MNFKILKRSLKSKKTINFILLVFIMLAAMFIAGSVNNLILITGGLDSYFEKAEVDDYVIISCLGGSAENPLEAQVMLEDYLTENEYVNNYSMDHAVFTGNSQIKKEDGSDLELNGTVLIMSYNSKQQKFFDENNKEITNVEDGYIYLPRREFEASDLKIGDELSFKMSDGTVMKLTVKGMCKDACLGSDLMGTHRFIVSENDMDRLLADGGYLYSRLYSLELNNLEEFKNEYEKQDIPVVFGDSKDTFQIGYIMDMIIAAIFIVASLLLVIISIVILRFAIVFTVNEDYKEIGIMKAIGISDKGIRKLYVVKYMLISIVGAMIGFGLSIPFSDALIKSAMKNMVIENGGSNILIQLVICIVVAAVVILFAYLSTSKIKKLTPMDAIRSGNNGERFKRKGLIKLHSSRKETTTFMAFNDVFSELKKYLILLFATMIGVWMVVMPINTINTLRSEKIADWFALQVSDIVISNEVAFNEVSTNGNKQGYYDLMDETEEIIENNGYEVGETSMEIGWQGIKVTFGDKVTKTIVFQGLGTDTSDYVYTKGSAPKYENEIAMTHVVAKRLGVDIGDTVYISIKGEDKPFVITAIYQSMNNNGEGIRVTEAIELDYSLVSFCFGVQCDFVDDLSEKEKMKAIDKLEVVMPECQVESFIEFIDRMIGGISDMLVPIKYAMLGIVMVVNILIVVLMQKMFLVRERGEMAMLKSIGFSNGKIISWQTKRIAIALFLGVVLGTLTGTPFSQLTSGQVFKMMGASKIEFDINYLEVYVIYPLVIFVASVLMCMVTMLSVRKITVNDMNEIE